MGRYGSLFWTPCAAYCVGKMLEDIARQDWVNTVLEEAKTITAMSVSEPLVKFLRMVDGDIPVMGYIYDGIERAKVVIKA